MEEKEYYQSLGCLSYGLVVISFIMTILFFCFAKYDGMILIGALFFAFLGGMTMMQIINSKKPVLIVKEDSLEYRSLYSGNYKNIPLKDVAYYKFENHIATMFGAELSGTLKVKVFMTNGTNVLINVPTDTCSAEEIVDDLLQSLAMYRASH